MALTACTAQLRSTPEPTATDMPQAGIPNPASVYCKQQREQTRNSHGCRWQPKRNMCFSGWHPTCDEWAYFRGECGPAAQKSPTPAMTAEATTAVVAHGRRCSGGYMPPGTSEEIADWWGVIKSTAPGAQYDDYFERQDLGQII